jgi:hypothetical protein
VPVTGWKHAGFQGLLCNILCHLCLKTLAQGTALCVLSTCDSNAATNKADARIRTGRPALLVITQP